MDYAGIKATFNRGVFAPVYVISGEEPYLLREIVERFIRHFTEMPGGEFNIDRLEGDASPEVIVELSQTPPFLADQRLVIVRDFSLLRPSRNVNSGEDFSQEPAGMKSDSSLITYLKNPSPTTCLVFYSPSGVDKRKRIFKAIEKAGHHVELKKPTRSEVEALVVQRAKSMGLPFDPEALNLFIQRVGNDVGQLVLEMDKLYTFLGEPSPQRRVTAERVRRLVPASPEDNIFAIGDALGERRVNRALAIARDLVRYGEHPIPLLFLILRHVRQLLQMKELQTKGLRETDWVRELKVPLGVARKLSEQARRFTVHDLRGLFQQLAAADIAIKTGSGEPLMTLELCLLAFASGQQ